MGFVDEFKKKVYSKLDERLDAEADLVHSIEEDSEKMQQLDDKIKETMESGGATMETAVDSLNRDHLSDQVEQAQQALEALRDTPLYSLLEYENECRLVQEEYFKRSNEIKARLIEKIEEALLVMDEVKILRNEANGCVQEIRRACADAGMNVNSEFRNSIYKSGAIGQYILIHENEYRKTLKNIISGLRR